MRKIKFYFCKKLYWLYKAIAIHCHSRAVMYGVRMIFLDKDVEVTMSDTE